jgi:hypothetical protein
VAVGRAQLRRVATRRCPMRPRLRPLTRARTMTARGPLSARRWAGAAVTLPARWRVRRWRWRGKPQVGLCPRSPHR